jgi:hypothetical protein
VCARTHSSLDMDPDAEIRAVFGETAGGGSAAPPRKRQRGGAPPPQPDHSEVIWEADTAPAPKFYDLNTKVPGEQGAPDPAAAKHHTYVCRLSGLATSMYLKAARVRRRRLRTDLVAALVQHGAKSHDPPPRFAPDTRGGMPPWLSPDTTVQALEDSDPEFDRNFEYAPSVLAQFASGVKVLQEDVYGTHGPPWTRRTGNDTLSAALEALTEEDLAAADLEASGTPVWKTVADAVDSAAQAFLRPRSHPQPSPITVQDGWVFASGPAPVTDPDQESPSLTLAEAGTMRSALEAAEKPFLARFREKKRLLQTTAKALLWGPTTCVLCEAEVQHLPPPTGTLAQEITYAGKVLQRLRELETTRLNPDTKWAVAERVATEFNVGVVPYLTLQPTSVFSRVAALGAGPLTVTLPDVVTHLLYHGAAASVAAASRDAMAASFMRIFTALETRVVENNLHHPEDLKTMAVAARMVASLVGSGPPREEERDAPKPRKPPHPTKRGAV